MVNDRQQKRKETEAIVIMVEYIVHTQQQDLLMVLNMVRTMISSQNKGWGGRAAIAYSMKSKLPTQVKHMDRLFGLTDRNCISNLRMDRNTFQRLCRILQDKAGLVDRPANSHIQVAGSYRHVSPQRGWETLQHFVCTFD
ncbi:hypothetical protein SASPL_104846 [Salvia splendens]|uniref:Uncharacterized protein n=1 Tax=Salvia splendens TaxID=180675 RepID=A0A8X8YI99_SALSN|nr:uncharacterized protein LOC121768799 [Salvia splendens]KAG6433238.1 hypothetical protein SASPL_104846 [Salvia splendens]